MVSQKPTERELDEQHIADVIQDHIEMDDSPYRYIFEVAIFQNIENEYPESIRYYLEAEDCIPYLNNETYSAVVCFKRVSVSSPLYAMSICNTFSR